MRAAFLLVLVGCYDPSLQPCAVRCSVAADCAGGLTCGVDGWCASGNLVNRCGTADASTSDSALTGDARPSDADVAPIDAPLVDASIACAPGCAGTCESGVCVIRCSAPNSCNVDVQCPATGPCRVECTGDRSCQKKVKCGTGDCDVVCSGDSACKDGIECGMACACDVTCGGPNACDKPAMCHGGAMCDIGDGCRSTGPAACNTCN
jgi:hypothetical protein